MTICIKFVAEDRWHRLESANCVIDIAPHLRAVTTSKYIHITHS